MQTITFRAKIGGSNECFLWCDIPTIDMLGLIGGERFQQKIEDERKFRKELNHDIEYDYYDLDDESLSKVICKLSPDSVFKLLGVESNKQYRFTISAEEII